MNEDENYDSDEIFTEPEEEAVDGEPDTESFEELQFDDEQFRGYEAVMSDMDLLSGEEEDEIPDQETQ